MSDSNRPHASSSSRSWIRAQLPTVLVILALLGIAAWGSLNEWRIPGFSGRSNPSASSEDGDETGTAAIRVTVPQTTNKDCPLAQTRITFESAETLLRSGVRLQAAEQKPLKATIAAPGEIDYDPTRVARLAAAAPGRIWRVEKEVGEKVRKGDVLALVDAAKVGESKATFLQAVTDLNLKTKTLDSLRTAGDGIAQQRVRESEAALRDARVRLFNAEQALINLGLPIKSAEVVDLPEDQLTSRMRFLGIPDGLVGSFDQEIATSNLLPLKAPFDGVIAERQAAPGEIVDPAKVLYVVADLTRVWLMISVRQEDMDEVKIGAAIEFEPDGHPAEFVRGKVTWQSTMVDERTRAIRVRADVENPQGHLPARTFGTAHITVRDATAAVVVPSEAVQREGLCRFVIVKTSDTEFEVRPVQVGVQSAGNIEIREGVKAGDTIASAGSFFLKSEILKDRLGDD